MGHAHAAPVPLWQTPLGALHAASSCELAWSLGRRIVIATRGHVGDARLELPAPVAGHDDRVLRPSHRLSRLQGIADVRWQGAALTGQAFVGTRLIPIRIAFDGQEEATAPTLEITVF